MRVGFGAVGVGEARHCSIIIEFDPLGWAGKPTAAGDVEVRDAPIVEDVTFRSMFKSFLIFEDTVLETLDLLGEAMKLHRSVGFAVGDRGEESVRDGVKECRIDVVVGGKGRLDGPRRHCWRDWSRWTRDWKGR